MADKKTTRVGSIKHTGTGMIVQLNVDRDSRLFSAEVAGERFEHAEGAVVERLVLEAIERAMDIPWMPIIVVSPWQQNGSEYKVFGFHAARIYVADLPNHVGWRETQWHAKDNKQRLAWSKGFIWQRSDGVFNPPCVRRGYSGNTTHYLPYTDAVWDRLVTMQQQIERVSVEFAAILESPEVMIRLASVLPLGLALAEPITTDND